jgi:RNA polymerase sigma-70 factor, ECF subfamily
MMTTANEDLELVAKLLDRQRSGWRELVDRFERLVCSRIRFTLELYSPQFDVADVEDLAAEVFADLLKNDLQALRNFQGQCRLATWLSVIAHRRALKWMSRRQRMESLSSNSAEQLSDNGEQLRAMLAREDAAEVVERLTMLKPSDQTILRLFYLEENSYQEISSKMGISVNSVGPKLSRAQQRLQKKMRAT